MRRQTVRMISIALLAVVIVAAAWALYHRGGDLLESLREHSWSLNPVELSISAVLLSGSLFLTPLGWIMICRRMGSKISLAELRAAWFSSQLGRYVPGKVWLFAGRAGFLRSRGMKGSRAAATTVYELVFSVASVGLIAGLAALASPELVNESASGRIMIAGGAFLAVLPLLHPVQRLLCRWKGIPLETLPGIGTAFGAMLFYSALWLLRGMAVFLLLRGTGIQDIDITRAVAAAPLSWLAGYIVVIVPGGLGIREAAAAAIAAPGSIAPAALVLACQRVFLTAAELLMAVFTSGKIISGGRENETDR